jgi:hypothetical protein
MTRLNMTLMMNSRSKILYIIRDQVVPKNTSIHNSPATSGNQKDTNETVKESPQQPRGN